MPRHCSTTYNVPGRAAHLHPFPTGSRTRLNGLPVPLTVPDPSPGDSTDGNPRQQRAVRGPGERALASSRPARGRRARPGRLPRLRGACRAADRATARPPGSPPSPAHRTGSPLALRRPGAPSDAGKQRGQAAGEAPGVWPWSVRSWRSSSEAAWLEPRTTAAWVYAWCGGSGRRWVRGQSSKLTGYV